MGQDRIAGGVKEGINQRYEDGSQNDAEEQGTSVDAQEECEDEKEYPEKIPFGNECQKHTKGKGMSQLTRCPVCVQRFEHGLKIVYHLCGLLIY